MEIYLIMILKIKHLMLVVSWLTLYHIANHEILLKKLFDLLNPNGFFYAEDITSRINLSNADRKEIKKEIYGIHLPYFDKYISNLEQNGFKFIFSEDMSSSWTDFTKERIKKYNSEKERNIRVHGKEVYDSLNSFYNFVGQYFSNGKLGGIRVIAKKIKNVRRTQNRNQSYIFRLGNLLFDF